MNCDIGMDDEKEFTVISMNCDIGMDDKEFYKKCLDYIIAKFMLHAPLREKNLQSRKKRVWQNILF